MGHFVCSNCLMINISSNPHNYPGKQALLPPVCSQGGPWAWEKMDKWVTWSLTACGWGASVPQPGSLWLKVLTRDALLLPSLVRYHGDLWHRASTSAALAAALLGTLQAILQPEAQHKCVSLDTLVKISSCVLKHSIVNCQKHADLGTQRPLCLETLG